MRAWMRVAAGLGLLALGGCRLEVGGACVGDVSCLAAPGCTMNDDCPGDALCTPSGFCVAPERECVRDTDCLRGPCDASGRCATLEAPAETTAEPARRPAFPDPRVVAPVLVDTPCHSDVECGPDQHCVAGGCYARCSADTQCPTDHGCWEAACVPLAPITS